MDLEKRIAIISAAASVGFSLHADPTKRNTQKRTHITLELPWSSEEFVQQLGRSHRSSQIHAPEYVIFQSPFPGEARFLAIVAHRLTMLVSTHFVDTTMCTSCRLFLYACFCNDENDVGCSVSRTEPSQPLHGRDAERVVQQLGV